MLDSEIDALYFRRDLIATYNSLRQMGLNGSQRDGTRTIDDLESDLSKLDTQENRKNFRSLFGEDPKKYIQDARSKIKIIKKPSDLEMMKVVNDSEEKMDELYALALI